MLDAIEHLRRGGRADRLIPLLGRVTKVLNIKPILEIVDGHLGLHRLVRSYERGLAYLVREIGQLKPLEHLAVVHTRNPEASDRLAGALSEQVGMPRQEIIVTETGPLLSVHAGSGVIGVAAVPCVQET